MSQEIELDCFRLIEENDLDVAELNEKIQRKITNLHEVIDEYNDSETDSEEEKNLELRMKALDAGIVEDLQPIIEKMQQDEAAENAANSAPINPMPNAGQSNNSETPSWRFWM
tara:strand:- start:294 stop:632 length:339 start_codon:yes stop_codon:yes gene_type:complete